MEPKIWDIKSEPKQTFDRTGRNRILDIDVTLEELQDPKNKASLAAIFSFLNAFWVGDDKARENNCKIGTMEIFFDTDGNFHMDFVTKFAVTENSQSKVKKLIRKSANNS